MTDKALAERLRKLAQAYRSVVVVDVTSINEATDLERAADLIEQMAQAEPVAWKAGGHLCFDLDAIPSHLLPPNKPAPQPLYLAPPAREPLSDTASKEREMNEWKVVPVEPTPAMLDAARSQSSFPLGVYRAMLASAPQPPAQPAAHKRQPMVEFRDALTDLVRGLEATNWSSWQGTHKFSEQLDRARELLDAHGIRSD
jgi:hypothetical protein